VIEVPAIESGRVVRLHILANGDARLEIIDTRGLIENPVLASATLPSWRLDRLTRRRPVVTPG